MQRKLKKLFKNKTILITGGTGSLGQKLVERILPFKPKSIRILSRSEKMQDDMIQKFPQCLYFLGDVRNYHSVLHSMRGCDLVIHLAACKHIIVAEAQPTQAVFTNVIGSINVVNSALHLGTVEKCLAISTDKAVDPLNTYGMTKKLMEAIFMEANRNRGKLKTVFSISRYGNVLGSSMSVVPLWRKQIDEGKTVTVTDPAMTRFIFTLDDAVNLVFYSLLNAKGGEIFSKQMQAVFLSILADAMTHGTASDWKVIGQRPGEKKHEILISEHEMKDTIKINDKKLGCLFIVKPGSGKSNMSFTLSSDIAYLMDEEEITELLKKEGVL